MEALEGKQPNAGGAYLRRGDEQQFVRGVGVITDVEQDIRKSSSAAEDGMPVHIADVATVTAGRRSAGRGHDERRRRSGSGHHHAAARREWPRGGRARQGPASWRSRNRCPPARNSSASWTARELIERTLGTAVRNLVEGGLLVIVMLFLFLLQMRAGLIVSQAIPLSMLIAIIGMSYLRRVGQPDESRRD